VCCPGRGPEPRFCSFVLAHETCKPSGADAEQKLDRISVKSWSWGSNKAVSSAYTRSVKLLRPTSIPGCADMCSIIQSMAMQKRTGARMHPCLNPDVVRNLPELLTNPNSSACGFMHVRNEIKQDWGTPLPHNVFQRAMRSTESNVAFISKKATSSGQSNSLCSSDKRR